eukprot:Skav229289  [mRNA]  locus=scaffold544:54833:73622:+ [translate_table: standard]
MRGNWLATSLVALAHGVPFFHAGDELLRSKSLDRDSYNSGDWFNVLDFSGEKSSFGVGLPPRAKNSHHWDMMRPILRESEVRPTVDMVRQSKAKFLELLQLRRSTALIGLKDVTWRRELGAEASWEGVAHADSQTWYANIAGHLEKYANQVLPAPLHPAQQGRATTMEVTWSVPHLAPLKMNRKGDVQSELPGVSLQHSRWTRQVRRLEHLARISDVDNSVTQWEHRINLWRSARKAPGFAPNFATWWADLVKQNPESPACLPEQPPTQEQARCISQELLHAYRQLETDIKTTRRTQAIERRSRDPMLIYQDIQREWAEPVMTIVRQQLVPVELSGPPEAPLLQLGSKPPPAFTKAMIDDVVINPEWKSPTSFVMPHTELSPAPTHICFDEVVADAQEIIREFHKEWGPRWQRHDQTSDSHWDVVVAFAKDAFPTVPPEVALPMFPPIDVPTWRRAVNKKKRAAATGPDGLSRRDLQHMPDHLLSSLLSLFHEIEHGRQWPPQAVLGIVSALAKTPRAQRITEFRPITIFSLTYRVWSSIRSRQCLKFLLRLAPTTMLGNMPGRAAKQMWFHLQECIEYAMATQGQLAGGVLDIVKCFNALPRRPLIAVAKILGIPSHVVLPWTNALKSMTRRFRVGKSTGPQVYSSTGFPEGDGLSVVAMALCNLLCDRWMRCQMPDIQIWSYVDNIEALADSGCSAVRAVSRLTDFCHLLDLEVDDKKTYCWANTYAQRKYLRDQQVHQKFYARDLGGHMNYCKMSTNRSVQDKIDLLQPFWSRLARSCAPVTQKLRALRVAAWPNLFYGGCTVTVGQNHFTKLRSQAMKSLGYQKPGANPILQLSCMNVPTSDPEFYHLWDTLVSYRDCHTPDLGDQVLTQLTTGHKPTPGPCKSFLTALHKLAWEWVSYGMVLDHMRLPIQVFQCPKGELFVRAAHAWQTKCFCEIEASRPTMVGLSNCDAPLTMQCLAAQRGEHQGPLRCMLNGTQYTNDVAVHQGFADDTGCSFCHHDHDCPIHRMWDCPAFQHVRAKFPDVMEQRATLPEVTCAHAWLPAAPHTQQWQAALLALPDTTRTFNALHFVDDVDTLDLFTDGSCLAPSQPSIRLATWGVVAWTGRHFGQLANGVVTGFRHTSLRGELTALLAALNFVLATRRKTRIWTDNQSVYNMLVAWLSNRWVPLDRRPDRDLWEVVFQQFRMAHGFLIDVVKVHSHCEADEQPTFLDGWAVDGNNSADRCAAAARSLLSSDFWELRSDIAAHLQKYTTLGTQMMQMFGTISLEAMQAKPKPVTTPLGHGATTQMGCDSGISALAVTQLTDVPMHFHVDETPFLMRWIATLVDPDVPCSWVSFHQLLLDYQMFSGRLGPRSVDMQWRPVTYKPREYSHPQHVTWLSRWMINVSKQLQNSITVRQCRPSSHVLAFWTGCISVAMTLHRLQRIDDHLVSHAASSPVRQVARDLGALPAAGKLDDF